MKRQDGAQQRGRICDGELNRKMDSICRWNRASWAIRLGRNAVVKVDGGWITAGGYQARIKKAIPDDTTSREDGMSR